MTWTRVSCCLVCACISWLTCCFISNVSLVVAVPVTHFNAAPKKGTMLFLDHGFSGGDMFAKSVLSSCTANLMADL